MPRKAEQEITIDVGLSPRQFITVPKSQRAQLFVELLPMHFWLWQNVTLWIRMLSKKPSWLSLRDLTN